MLNLFKIIIFLQLFFWPELKKIPILNGNRTPDVKIISRRDHQNSTPVNVVCSTKLEIRAYDTNNIGIIQSYETKCVLPSPVDNGKYSIISLTTGDFMEATPGDLVENGTSIIHECNDGYYADSSRIDTCHDGKWNTRFSGCIRFNYCDLPEFPQNGNYEITGYSSTTITPGQQVAEYTILTFFCAPLYDLVNAKKIVCIAGAWNSDSPTCKQMEPEIVQGYETKCVLPSPVDNGKYSISNSTTVDFIEPTPGDLVENGTIIKHECNDGYYADSSRIDICHDGKWKKRFLGCIKNNNCDLPEFPQNGYYEITGYSITTVKPGQQVAEFTLLTFSCEPLYDLVDAKQIVCIAEAWNSDPPTCKRSNRCVLPDPPANGRYELIGSNRTALAGEIVEVGNALYYTCDPGYSLKYGKVTHCHNGSWIGGPIECKDSTSELTLFKDCSDVSGFSGVYNIKPNEQTGTIAVYCELNLKGTKWTVIQQRFDGSVDFYRDYESYKHFFGDAQGNYWIGLENMHQITKNEDYELYVELETHYGHKASARYKTFSVGSGSTGYKLRAEDFDTSSKAKDGLSWHSGFQFSTFDNDRDNWLSGNCAERFHGGWWYGSCSDSNLNGGYFDTGVNLVDSMHWFPWFRKSMALKSSRMFVRKI